MIREPVQNRSQTFYSLLIAIAVLCVVDIGLLLYRIMIYYWGVGLVPINEAGSISDLRYSILKFGLAALLILLAALSAQKNSRFIFWCTAVFLLAYCLTVAWELWWMQSAFKDVIIIIPWQ
jgi:hypothetical protein